MSMNKNSCVLYITGPELVREIELGPFKHKIDDGFPLRTAAFLCMDTIIEKAAYFVDFSEFISYVALRCTY